MTACRQVLDMPLEERKKMVTELRLCRGCLRQGHLWRNCQRKARCETCNKIHPTLLHDPEIAAQGLGGQSATCLQSISNSCHCLVMPVMLSNRERPERQVLVYALLDAQSDTCFVSKSACAAVNASGRSTSLELSTIAGRTVIDSEVVDDLIIQPLQSEDVIPLPGCYTRSNIPCSRSSIPRRETARKWGHLKEVAEQIPDYVESAEIGLLLGTSCSRAIKPHEVIPGREDEPWAVRTALGWGIVGTIDTQDERDNMCRYVDAGNGRKKICHFSFKTLTSESPRDILRVLEKDFEETRDKVSLGTAVEDREFFQQVSAGFHKTEEGHAQMPLPLKSGSTFPNNRRAVEQRLRSLRSKLQKVGSTAITTSSSWRTC